MSQSDLEKAHSLLRRRKFSYVISLLESGNNPDIYRENFDYFLTVGLACLYLGDTGSAGAYFQRARRIRVTDTTLLNAQAVLFLIRGETDRAIEYYLDVLEYNPSNRTALRAMDFLKEQWSEETLFRAVDSGKIEKFYPPLGVNPDTVKRIVFSVSFGVLLSLLVLNSTRFSRFVQRISSSRASSRADLSELFLSVEENENLRERNLSGGVYRYILSDRQIKKSYNDALAYFQDYRENAARVEVNRILNSNASEAVKKKSEMILSYFSEPTFDSLDDNYSYSQVSEDPALYLGCWVSWSGRISNAVTDGKSYRCDLLVGYENMARVDGVVPLYFAAVPEPPLDGGRPVTVLAKISVSDGKIVLDGRAVYQPLGRKTE